MNSISHCLISYLFPGSQLPFKSSCFLAIFKYLLYEELPNYQSYNLDVIFTAEGDGSKIYVSCVAFRDPVCEDIAEAYQIPANSFADKCICLVSRSPSFGILRDALEEIYALCFSPGGSR